MLTTNPDHNSIRHGPIPTDALMAAAPCERPFPTAWAYFPSRGSGDSPPCRSAPAGYSQLVALPRLAAAQSGQEWPAVRMRGDMSRYGTERLAQVKHWPVAPMIMGGGHEVIADVGAGATAHLIQTVTEARACKDVRPGRVECPPVSDVA
jgi:hypothetical protein